jgi:hypothetical protein
MSDKSKRIVRDFATRYGMKYQQAKQQLAYILPRISQPPPAQGSGHPAQRTLRVDRVLFLWATSGDNVARLISDKISPLTSLHVNALADLMPKSDSLNRLRDDLLNAQFVVLLLNFEYVFHYKSISSAIPEAAVARTLYVRNEEADALRNAVDAGSPVVVVTLERGVIEEVPELRRFEILNRIPFDEMSGERQAKMIESLSRRILVKFGVRT